ncbi:hypothetical protein CASFOL_005309 [Castilleja foliolosa]|uniref:Uncharacterized protein n=1 Tax=Castilleja foliolosa TaxID=1961234 RepID=A0ABD3E347_9LAMI
MQRREEYSPTEPPNRQRRQISVSHTQLVYDPAIMELAHKQDEAQEDVSSDDVDEDVPSNDVYDGSDVDEYIIDYLIEEKNVKHLKYMIQKYSVESNQQLCESLTPLIKNHLPIKNMGALTILIGYFSARNNVLGFADLVGRGGAVGIYTARYSDSQDDDMKIEPISTSAGGPFVETSSSCTLEELMPDTSLIDQLLNDASLNNLAQQIHCNRCVVSPSNFIINHLKSLLDGQKIDSFQLNRVLDLWQYDPLKNLRRTLKESPNLRNTFKILSDGAQMLRLKERLDRIRGASFWKTNDFDESDFALKMRLALSILIGYWSARDVSKLVMHLLHYQIKNPMKAHLLEDLRDVEVICYFVDSNHDLEGLKNVLAIKYVKDSPEFTSRFVEIEHHHQKLKVRKAAESLITAILKNKKCIMIY